VSVEKILMKLESLGTPENIAGMARYGIRTKRAFGVASGSLGSLVKEIKAREPDRHRLALELWETGFHEARVIAYLIDDPKRVTSEQMESWVSDFDNWAICDSTCGRLFSFTNLAYQKAYEWIERDEEFVKRAGIAMIVWISVHDKKASDDVVAAFLPELEKAAADDRSLIRKAVSWALRTIGKRSPYLNKTAIETAERIRKQHSPSARWIAADALRELRSEKVIKRLGINK
jgi:3-methyladenine DNA glycosylase AlkD